MGGLGLYPLPLQAGEHLGQVGREGFFMLRGHGEMQARGPSGAGQRRGFPDMLLHRGDGPARPDVDGHQGLGETGQAFRASEQGR
jgi:hypothetical protein